MTLMWAVFFCRICEEEIFFYFYFQKVLAAINVAFSSMAKSTDPVGVLFAEIASEYEYKFKRAFGMIKKQEDKE